MDTEDPRPQAPGSGPQSPATGPQPPAPEAPAGPQSPAAPGYTGPVPPGGWQQPVQPTAVGGQLASWGTRLGAYLIDGLVLAVPAVLLFVLIVGSIVGVSGDDEDFAIGAFIGAMILFGFVMFVIFLLYAPLLMARDGERNGQTLGKQVLGIRVVRNNGQPMNFGTAALREAALKWLAVLIASSIIPLIPWFLNFFWPLWDDENRALHDMASSTHVVKA